MASEVLLFFILIAVFVVSLILFPFMRWITIGFVGLVLLYLFYKFFVKKYSEYERGIILRLGKLNRIAGPGWHMVVPFFERELSKIDIRTHQMSLLVPEAFTEREIRLKINGFVYYKVVDPKKAILNIDDYRKGLRNLMTGTTRDIISSMSITEVFANIREMNKYINKIIKERLWKWGLEVSQIELVRVTPPEDIINAMQRQKKAKEEYQARKLEAEAKKVVMEALGEGARSLDNRAISYLYLKALQEVGGEATEMIFPMRFLNGLENIGKQIGKGAGGGGGGMGLGALGGMTMAEAIDKVKNKIKEGGKKKAKKKIDKKVTEGYEDSLTESKKSPEESYEDNLTERSS